MLWPQVCNGNVNAIKYNYRTHVLVSKQLALFNTRGARTDTSLPTTGGEKSMREPFTPDELFEGSWGW